MSESHLSHPFPEGWLSGEDYIRNDYSIEFADTYGHYKNGDPWITLDGCFTIENLEAFVAYMKAHPPKETT